MNENIPAWKDLSETIWNCVATIGLILGGIWTISTFQLLGQRTRAEWDVRNAEWQVKKLKAEEDDIRARAMSALTADLTADPLTTSDGRQFIATTLTVKNNGNRVAVLPLGAAPITAARIQFKDAGAGEVLGPVTRGHIYIFGSSMNDASGLAVLPNETKICRSLVPVAAPGLYFVSVFAYRPKSEDRLATEAGMPKGEHAAIWPSQYVEVSKEGEDLHDVRRTIRSRALHR